MAGKNLRRLEERRARYETKLGSELTAMIESDTNVMTARVPENLRLIASRHREVVRLIANF